MKKIYNVFDRSLKNKIFLNLFLLIIATIIETISIGSILPLINLILTGKENVNLSIFFGDNFDILLGFNQLISIFVIIFVLKNIYLIFFNWKINSFTRDIRLFLSRKLINGYLRMDLKDFKKENTPELNRNLIIQVSNFSEVIKSYLQLATEILLVSSILMLLLYYNFNVTFLLILFFFTFMIIYIFIFKKILINLGNQSASFSKQILKDIENCFLNFKLIKIRNLENLFEDNFIIKNKRFVNSSIYFNFIQSLTRIWLEIFIVIILIIIIYSSINMKDVSSIDLTTISFFFIASLKILPSSNKIINYIQKLKFSKITIKLILNTFKKFKKKTKKKEKINKKTQLKNYSKIKNNQIELKSISYKYNNTYILRNFSVSIKNNQIYLICGPSGSGKTTLVELIIGLINPIKGMIYLGKKPINDFLKVWQSKISYVSQNSYLIEDTLKNNIIFDQKKSNFDKQKYQKAIKASCLNEMSIRNRWNDRMKIGQNAINISGGQAQRVGIARALYQDFDTIIFDETFNSLDKKTISKILKNIKKYFSNKKIIIISHDNYFKSISDRIISSNKFINNKKVI